MAQKYAKALFSVAKQKGNQIQVGMQLAAIYKGLDSVEGALQFFQNPLVSGPTKLEVVKKAIASQLDQVNPDLLQLIFVLGDNDRLGEFKNLTNEYNKMLDADSGIMRGTVRSAATLDAEALANLEKKIGNILKTKVLLSQLQDTSLLGGAIVEVGGWTFDDTLSSHLDRLSEKLINS